MNYEIGHIVRIKSKDWYEKNKNEFGKVWTTDLTGESRICFDHDMVKYCGKNFVIEDVEPECYALAGIPYAWTDEMIECRAENDDLYIDDGHKDIGQWKDVYLAFVRIDQNDAQPFQGVVIKAKGKLLHGEPFLAFDEFEYCGRTVPSMTSFDQYYLAVGPNEETCLVLPDLETAVKEIFVKIRMFTVAGKSMEWLDVIKTELNDDELPDIYYINESAEEECLDYEWIENLLSDDEKKLLGIYQDPFEAEAMFDHFFSPSEEEDLDALVSQQVQEINKKHYEN